MSQIAVADYRLTIANSARAVERGLAEADWYTCPVPKAEVRKLLERRNGPAIRDTLLWFMLLLGFGAWGYEWWGSAWAIIPFMLYGVIYGSTSDSRWHESNHGTAFKTDWMNDVLYEIASFMVMREATVWRWSHNRHHSDTIIVGRDPEIAVPRLPDIRKFIFTFFGVPAAIAYFKTVFVHCTGRLTPDERTFIPVSEYGKVIWRARLYALIYAVVIGFALYQRSLLPLMFIGLPNLYGAWLMPIYGYTQHAGLAENVLDHRLNCRTVYMNPINRYLYWNMNYHVEHHMFPLVPYHALPRLHELVRTDMPRPYGSIWQAWRELLPVVLRQRKDPAYHVKRQLPPPPPRAANPIITTQVGPDAEGWIEVCDEASLRREDVLRCDHGRKTYALYRDAAGALFATDGVCTHGNTHLADGLVKGGLIECPKHNGRYNLADGSPARAPVCRGLCTYPIESRNGKLFLNVVRPGGVGARTQRTLRLRVVSNCSVATFIKEIAFEPADRIDFTPGDYLQFDIPAYDCIRFRDLNIPQPYASVWEAQHVFDLVASNPASGHRNNYSLACNPQTESILRFNVRIATPPPGQDCPPGAGSAYMFNLKPGDTVTAIGPFGDFHIKPTQKEMVYIGGGSGMAPLRAHLSHLFETDETARKVSFWYGARSRQELFYQDYFEGLAARYPNFRVHFALSAPLPEDHWTGHCGFIHEVVLRQHLKSHENPRAMEYYLCGPPLMINACTKMLDSLNVDSSHIAFDEF
ncbi:MAG: NADH:ubiquinone reductase (Na(+)-transporting) subunit F [Thermoguttaceae bacterium]|jgi:MocE subfamily Rieske [2Fe-2S] domain protein